MFNNISHYGEVLPRKTWRVHGGAIYFTLDPGRAFRGFFQEWPVPRARTTLFTVQTVRGRIGRFKS